MPATTRVGVPPLVHGAAVAVGSGSPLGLVGTGPPGTALELVVVGGPDAGHARALVPPGVHVGRGVASGLTLGDDALSRVHALVRVGPTGIAVEDMGSTNGVRVDGRPVIGSTAVDTSSTITLGSSTVRVRRAAGAGIPVVVLGDGTIVVRPTSDEVPSSGPVEVECPAAPVEPARARIPWVGALVPVPIGLALAWFLGPQLLLFTLLGPVALLANAAVDRWGAGRARRRDRAAHATA
ncbi:MAG TPA: FHA domain-containing protein, partial [Ornithinibacter sp.]|nr:FHA domain-containing protein [Ornithinibacter sp.]